jgi:hypothetical protein
LNNHLATQLLILFSPPTIRIFSPETLSSLPSFSASRRRARWRLGAPQYLI